MPQRALHDLMRGMMLARGWSPTTTATAAGLSPETVRRWTSRASPALTTWLRLVAAFGARAVLCHQGETYAIALPTYSTAKQKRTLIAWRKRRQLNYIQALRHQFPRLKRQLIEQRARQYADNDAKKMIASVSTLKTRMRALLLSGEQESMRATITNLINAAQLSCDAMAYAAGLSVQAVSATVAADDDGRLTALRQMLAALDIRLDVVLSSGKRLAIARVPLPKTAQASNLATQATTPAPTPRSRTKRRASQLQQSNLTRSEVLARYDQGQPITRIAQDAGISRQRVHAIVKKEGRTLRRVTTHERRIREAVQLLKN